MDTMGFMQDTIRFDTTWADTSRVRKFTISPDAVDMPIVYNALDSQYINMEEQKVYLVNGASAVYGDVSLEAYHIVLDLNTSEVNAWGRRDSTGKLVDIPRFKDAEEEFEADELTYNFKTKKAIIRNIVTEEEEGFLHSDVTKRHEDGSLHVRGSKYTTCDAEDPHYYVSLPRAKVIPGEKIVSGPAFLVLEDIPLPLVLPFGYFPVQKEYDSGILIPRYGEENNRGYFLKGMGYYFAINDYFDLSLTGDIYTNGTWRLNATSHYTKRYKFNGNFSFNYANNITGYKGLENYSKSSNYSVRWTHSQDAKAMPGTRFSASVNLSSSGYDRENSYIVQEHVNTTKQSSISYSKTWAGSPFNFSASLNHSQNSASKSVSLNLPKMSFGMSRIYPLKEISGGGATKWWQELQLQYTASLDNRIATTDEKMFTGEMFEDMKNGFQHDIPVSLPIRPFRNFSVSPTLRYSGVLFTERTTKRWEPEYIVPVSNDTTSKVISEKEKGFYYGHAINPSISASYSPQIFGMFQFKNPDSRIIAVRHVMKPSVSFSFVPAVEGLSSDMYREVQVDTAGNTTEYSIFENGIYSTPSLSRRNGNLNFSLANIIEAKVRSKTDTADAEKKVKIIDNLSLNTSYNIFADSLKWSPLSMVMRTTLFEELSISARGNFDMYATDSLYRRINASEWSVNRRPFRMTNLNISLNFELNNLLKSFFGEGKEKEASPQAGSDTGESGLGGMPQSFDSPGSRGPAANRQSGSGMVYDEYGYVDFNVPWSMRVAYNFYYTKMRGESTINQNVTMSGNVTLTNNFAITYSTGYDFRSKEITMTRIGISRDLHCWEMSFNYIPTGYLKSWDFVIRVKASVLRDLKYERRKDYHDNY
ncbi:MAG: putative LPS assembly protein LptD [Bacteroidota bacterium]|nr:putative LPS assembly protein LptD [Bacteroidota bacterium]